MAEQLTFQLVDGGSIPTSPLQYTMRPISVDTAKRFTIKHHYSGSCPSGGLYFGLYDDFNLIGVAVFGPPAGRRQAQYYCPENPDGIVELRRLCCIDDTPKNTESRFIGLCLRWLKKNTKYIKVLSLADPSFGHQGIIYQACNFRRIGETEKPGNCRPVVDGVEIHPRSMYAKHGTSDRNELKRIYGEHIRFLERLPKIAYIYELKRK